MRAPRRLAGQKEDDEMAYRYRRPLIAATLLATALALAGPAEAGSRSPVASPEGVFARVFQWLEMAWVGASAGSERGSGIDPNGTPTGAACLVECDKGSGVDPNGG
jgi:hypothetical protein